MGRSMNSFRQCEPMSGNPILNLSFSFDGEHVLIITTAAQAVIMDRDGMPVVSTTKGDMYLTDIYKTKGHTAGITDGFFNPNDTH